jgi:ribosomal protein S18 acetylase RimI-like enzyme
MLYHALYAPPGQVPFPREIVNEPGLRRYVEGWGRPGDFGVIALEEGQPVGAAWARLLTGANGGYGYVNDATPELSIAVLPDHRGRGVGSQLLAWLIETAQGRCPALSLSVSRENPARRLYERAGFTVVAESGGALTMAKTLA